jgi:hypothetical protein
MDPDPGGPKTGGSGSGCGSVTQVKNKNMPIHKTGRRYAVWRIRNVYPRYRILIFTHPGSRISNPKTATKERVEKKCFVINFYSATYFTKLNIILVLKS